MERWGIQLFFVILRLVNNLIEINGGLGDESLSLRMAENTRKTIFITNNQYKNNNL